MAFGARLSGLGVTGGLIGGRSEVVVAFSSAPAGAEGELLPLFSKVSDYLCIFANGKFRGRGALPFIKRFSIEIN